MVTDDEETQVCSSVKNTSPLCSIVAFTALAGCHSRYPQAAPKILYFAANSTSHAQCPPGHKPTTPNPRHSSTCYCYANLS